MNTKFTKTGLIATSLTVGLSILWLATPSTRVPGVMRSAMAAEEPQVIEIKAKKFEFTPNEITLKKGQPVVLRLTTEDRTHGFFLKPLKIDADIVPDKPTDVAVTPETSGTYTAICDHYCGTGHGMMKMKIVVE